MSSTEKEQKKQTDRTALLRSMAVVVVVLALIIGLTYAWFFNQSNIATLITVAPPSKIALRGPHGQELSELNLSYTDNDVTTEADGTKKVTIHRVVSVKNTGEDHKLEIVHTTNMKGLTFQLYAAAEQGAAGSSSDTVTNGGYTYTYNQSNPLTGSYINLKQSEGGNGYKYANDTQHQKNYSDYMNVQTHAEPLYWIVNDPQKATGAAQSDSETAKKKECLTYYVLEISWTETGKETDIFYVLAQNEG